MCLRIAALPVAALVMSIAVPAALAQETEAVAEGKAIVEVVVRGLVNTNQETVLTAAQLKPGGVFANRTFEEDWRRIRDLGLYASVGGRVETTPDGRLRVIYEVVENPRITNIQITGNQAVRTEDLRTQIRSNPGEVLNTVTVEQDIQRLQNYYSTRNFLAFVSDQAGIDPKTGVLTFPIVETIVENVRIEGNKKTKDFVFLREMRSKPGQPYNTDVLQRDLSRIAGLQILDDIGPARREPGSELGRVNLIIPVQERRTGSIGVSFGYSTRQRLVGALELAETNFRGRGQGLNFRWEVGGIASRNSFEVGFSEPWIDRQNTSLSLNLFDRVVYRFNRSLSNNATGGLDDDPYFERRQGGVATLSRPFADTTRGYMTFRTEKIDASSLALDYTSFTDEQIRRLRGALIQNGGVASITLRSATNTRDFDLDPANGLFFSPSAEFGTSDFDYERPRLNPAYVSDAATPGVPRVLIDRRNEQGGFAKYNMDLRRYFSLSGPRRQSLAEPKRVLATRVLFGAASGAIGFSEQYFVGGAETLRGYPDDRFWGNRLFLASAELRLPLDPRGTVTGVLFSDVGDAWGATELNREDIPGFQQHSSFKANVGVGVGLRLKTPVGPVRLDYAVGEGSRTHFGVSQSF